MARISSAKKIKLVHISTDYVFDGEKGDYNIGGTSISYVRAREASRYAQSGYVVKPVDLEDLFIMKGDGK
jgi:hypothetical protein